MSVIKGKSLGEAKKESINELFWNAVQRYPEVVAICYRQGESWENPLQLTYRELGERVKTLAQGLLSLGIKKGDKVSLLSETRYEWVQADFAILTAGGVTVTIYPTLLSATIQFIIDNSDSKIVIVENQEQLGKVLSVRKQLPQLEHIIVMEIIKNPPAGVYTLPEVMAKGRQYASKNPQIYEKTWRSVTPEDLSSIVYTSGTTGLPKGAMLSHWNWRFNVYAAIQLISFLPAEKLLAFLPLAHVYMRLVYFAAVNAGATSYFSRPDQLSQDLPAIRPIAFVSVPRLFERVYDRLTSQVESGSVLQKKIFYWADTIAKQVGEIRASWQEPSLGLKLKHRLADKLVFSKIRQKMGVNNLKWTCSAGSSLRKDLAYFFNGMGITIIEGYGMTEVAAPSNLNPAGRFKIGSVGPPLPGTRQKLAADGEILIKGDNVMQGYYKLPEESQQSFTEDDWLKTGDIGEFDSDGYLFFKERKKHILVLSTGKNVAPLPLEEKLKKSRWIEEAVLIGDDKRFISALIQPAYQPLLEFAQQKNIAFDQKLTKLTTMPTGEEGIIGVDRKLLENKAISELFEKIVDEANTDVDPYEQVKRFRLIDEAVTMEKGELTPTFKIKKKIVYEKYSYLIDEIYS